MTTLQKSIYRDTMQRSRKTIMEVIAADPLEDDLPPEPKGKGVKKKAPTKKEKKMYLENSSNVLMDLRKAALHPALFRRRFTDEMLADITRVLLKEPDYKKRGAVYQYCYEDMGVMTDSELQLFLSGYKSTTKFLHDTDMYFDAGKVQVLMRLLEDYLSQGRKVLVFSQVSLLLTYDSP
jgi:SWI/SNF-related matrix-associated actin-dependent regulator of chromatin subfamily A containing DEAD/H box 1